MAVATPAHSPTKPTAPVHAAVPTLFPPWEVEWQLNRSTIAQPCNYSGWFDVELAAQFGVRPLEFSTTSSAVHPPPTDRRLTCCRSLVSTGPTTRTPGEWTPACRHVPKVAADALYASSQLLHLQALQAGPVPRPGLAPPPPSYRRVPLVCAEASSAQEDLLTQAEMVRDAICSFCSGVPSVSQEEEVQQ